MRITTKCYLFFPVLVFKIVKAGLLLPLVVVLFSSIILTSPASGQDTLKNGIYLGTSYKIYDDYYDVYLQGTYKNYMGKRSHLGIGLAWLYNESSSYDYQYHRNIFLPSVEYGWNYKFFRVVSFSLSLKLAGRIDLADWDNTMSEDEYDNYYGVYFGPDLGLGIRLLTHRNLSFHFFSQFSVCLGKTYQSYLLYYDYPLGTQKGEFWTQGLDWVVPISYGLLVKF